MTKICWNVFQAVPLFLSEIAPAKLRGGLNIVFQLMITIGILIANIVNYFTSSIRPYGWRLALGGAGVPALILLFGSLLICETPTSLIERNKLEEGKRTLKKIRGVENVDAEFQSIVHACDFAKQVKDRHHLAPRPWPRPINENKILSHIEQMSLCPSFSPSIYIIHTWLKRVGSDESYFPCCLNLLAKGDSENNEKSKPNMRLSLPIIFIIYTQIYIYIYFYLFLFFSKKKKKKYFKIFSK